MQIERLVHQVIEDCGATALGSRHLFTVLLDSVTHGSTRDVSLEVLESRLLQTSLFIFPSTLTLEVHFQNSRFQFFAIIQIESHHDSTKRLRKTAASLFQLCSPLSMWRVILPSFILANTAT